MEKNLIATRIADFLFKYPPFSYLGKEEILGLAKEAEVKYFQPDEYVFKQDQKSGDYLFVVKEGVVHLERQEADTISLVDVCDEGDLFGVRAMISGNPYVFQARCEDECLIYALPITNFRSLMELNSQVAMFFASGLAGGQSHLFSGASKNRVQESGSLLNWNSPLRQCSQLIWCKSTVIIREVAKMMTEKRIGSMVICEPDGSLTGIVTDTDFKTKIATGILSIDDPVAKIMSTQVVAMPLGLPLSDYLLKMLRHKIKHICIVDGNKPVGVLSQRDLLASQQNHPVALVYALEQSKTIEELAKLRNQADGLVRFYLEQNVSMEVTSSLVTHMNDVLMQRIIKLKLDKYQEENGAAPVSFCWVSMGSEGRGEQLLRTDQDNALIYADSETEDTQQYFLGLATQVNFALEQVGFKKCPADMMAGNSQWCQPLSQWEHYFSGWIRKPQEKALMLSTIFFDYRFIYGDENLLDELNRFIQDEISSEKIFLNFLAKNALKNPAPLGFFKNLMIERSGEHKNDFDIKARAMMPLVDMARVLSLDAGIMDVKNTIGRYQVLAEKDPSRRELYEEAADAYEYLMRFRAISGFEHNNSGRYVPIDSLGKLDRQILRNTFEPIDKLQKMLSLKYQLSYFQ
ncbi:DUF294 nucleotidyltransferase-like domain-containing protein [Fulvivirga ligni]|uniref:DUF294 nucleotidyltransferase-like domain-containing protein n=1 Tax=Fulvivirga ligni TaxID=2904246 RepID=UPI001F18C9D6|nr:DUF294 nucleotidyltransferase-like domain-containing protein [Fulvivirga ligni]UII22074.1 DUF294 nucleotidyltransferase-like domain-containing protein [Fulvivirga ligni]